MTIQLYIKTNTIGLCFNTQPDRDTFWTLLGEHQNCAERFGNRTIRFDPAKATSNFSIPLETDAPRVVVIKQVGSASKPSVPKYPDAPSLLKPGEVFVIPTAPAPIEPIAIIPATPHAEPVAMIDPPTPTAELPPSIPMPQIGSVETFAAGTPNVTKPPDMRSRAGRAWKAQQAK